MAISLTFQDTNPRHPRTARWPVALMAAALVAVATPGIACDGAAGRQVASAAAGVGVFTGELVDGAPVYRLPAINVVGHRQAAVAKTQRGLGSAPGGRSAAKSAAAAPTPNRNVVTVSRDVNAARPCIG